MQEHEAQQHKVKDLQDQLAKAKAERTAADAKAAEFEAAVEINQASLHKVAALREVAEGKCRAVQEQLEGEMLTLHENERAEEEHLKSRQRAAESNRARCAEMEAALAESRSKVAELEKQKASLQQKLIALEQAMAEVEAECGTAEARVADRRAAMEAIQVQVAETEAKVAVLDAKSAAVENALAQAKAHHFSLEEQLAKALVQKHVEGSGAQDIAAVPAQTSADMLAEVPNCPVNVRSAQTLAVISQMLPGVAGQYKLLSMRINDRVAFCTTSASQTLCLVWLPGVTSIVRQAEPVLFARHCAWAFIKESVAMQEAQAAGLTSVQLEAAKDDVVAISLQESWASMPYEMARPGWWSGDGVVHLGDDAAQQGLSLQARQWDVQFRIAKVCSCADLWMFPKRIKSLFETKFARGRHAQVCCAVKVSGTKLEIRDTFPGGGRLSPLAAEEFAT
eukprot:5476393-Amphidinium_carterae.1